MKGETFEELRPRAFAIAYRMLGSVSEAEDVVQEAYLRLDRAERDGERIESPRAYLSTVVTRLAIDQFRSARSRREEYVGEWLPEPLLADPDPQADPARQAEVADTLSLALLVLLESLSPEQRAVFLLREVFDYPYERIAEIVGKSEPNVRQLAVRARRHVEKRRVRFDASREQREQLADRFFAAATEGDLPALEALLAEDVELHGDGGGKVPALARALFGRERVAKTLRNWMRTGQRIVGIEMRRVDVNGQPGAMLLDAEGRVFGVMALDIADGQIQGIRSIVKPDKLGHLGQEVADLTGVLRRRSEKR
jgi:RNA polymerase sigma-70 factor (TIGR02957 family)